MRIPTYEQQAQYQPRAINKFEIRDQTPDMRLNVTPDMFGGAQAKIIGQASQDLQRGAALGMRAYAEWQDTKATAAFNQMIADNTEKIYGPDGILNLKGEAAEDAPAKLQQLLDESGRKYADFAGGDLGKGYLKMRVERYAQQLMPRAMQHAAVELQNFKVSTYEARAGLMADEALKNADNAELFLSNHAEGLQNISLAGRAKGLSEELIEVKRRKFSSELYMGKVQGQLTAGKIGDAQKTASSGFLTGDDRLRADGAIRAEQKRAEAEARANAVLSMQDIRDNLQDQELMASQTGNITPLMESAAKLKALGNTRGAAALLKKAEIYGNNHAAIEKVQSLPLPEGLKYIEDIDTRLQDASAKGDTASYSALTHERSVVAKSLQGMVKGLQDDPAKAVSRVVIGDTPARIAESRMTAQAQHGLSLGARRVLTKAEAEKLYTDWQQGDITKKMSVASALQEYGTYAGKAAQEAGIGASEQLAMQNAMDDPMNVPHLQTIITASAATSDALPILKDEKTLTASAVEDSKIMKVYAAAARVMQGNASLQGNIRQMEKTMGNLLRMNGGNTDAALKVFDGTMDAVVDSNVTVAFNPKVVASGDIKNGLKEAMQGDLETFLGGRKYRTPYEKTDYLYHLRKSGMWVNAPDGKGYILIDPVSQAPVMREDGHTFRKTNADILHYKDERQPMDPYEVDDMLADTLP